MTTVTQWFGGRVKPAHVGHYQRNYGVFTDIIPPDFWDGKCWRYGPRAYGDKCLNQKRPWRGLAEKPQESE